MSFDYQFPDVPDSVRAQVQSAPPGFRPVRFKEASWQAMVASFTEIQLDLKPLSGAVRRDEVVELAKNAIRDGRLVDAFVLTMLWGYGPAGYGPDRTAKVLRQEGSGSDTVSPAVHESLRTSLKMIDADRSGETAFGHLNYGDAKLKDLGPSFFTKWLYVASAKGDPESIDALPVLDEVTRDFVNAHRGPMSAIRRGYKKDYARYVALLRHWAEQLGSTRSAVEVEVAIFVVAQSVPEVSWTGDRGIENTLSATNLTKE